LRLPVFAGHDPLHEFIEQRYGECGIAMAGAPNHALDDQLASRRAERRDTTAQVVGSISRPVRTGTKLGHGAQIFLFQRRQAVESNPEKAFVQRCDCTGCRVFDVLKRER
jgi:hypothetical protein